MGKRKGGFVGKRWVWGLILVFAGWGFWFWWVWTQKTSLEPSGGLYFPVPVRLDVPGYRQNDVRWGRDRLGGSDGTLGSEGCAVSSVAMVFGYYGLDTDPKRLHEYLTRTGGYTKQGWIYWERAAELSPRRVRHVYEDLPSYRLVDWNLLCGNPVIVRVRLRGGTHFVVIAGKKGRDYLIRDPGAGASKGLYPLRELGSRIEALRFYERLR
jgi:hypothetical protein